MKIKSIIFPLLVLLFSCNINKNREHDNITIKNQKVMDKQEQKIYDAIEAFGEPGISAETLSENLNILINEVEKILNKLEDKELVEKTKAHVYEKTESEGTVIKGALLYTVRKK